MTLRKAKKGKCNDLEVGSMLVSTATLQLGVALKLLGASRVCVAHFGHLPVGEGGAQLGRSLDTTQPLVEEADLKKHANKVVRAMTY